MDSDSFQSRSSGGGSDDDGEAAVRRTERRAHKFRMAAIIQARMRGILDRIRVNHRRAVMERMVRKARAEEREALEFKRYGLSKEVEAGSSEIEEESFDATDVDESDDNGDEDSKTSIKVKTDDDISSMVSAALEAAARFGFGGQSSTSTASPTPGMDKSYVSSDSSENSVDLALRVESALYEDSFASGFGEGSADVDMLLSSMASEHAENSRIAEQATGAAVEAVANVTIDLVVAAVLEELFKR